MPLKSGSSKKVVSGNIKEMMKKYKKKGSIGTSKPTSSKKAQKQAVAIALSKARESVELVGKLLNEETLTPEQVARIKKMQAAQKSQGQAAAKLLAQSEAPTAPGEAGHLAGLAIRKIRAGKKAKEIKQKTLNASTEYYGTQLIEKLCAKGKAAAKRKFDVYPSAYANMYASAVCSGKVKPGGKKK